MNRREFMRYTTAPLACGLLLASDNAGATFGHSAPPVEPPFPELNWIIFPSPITGIAPMRRDQLVTCADGLYELTGCGGPFQVDARDPRRLWAMYIDIDMARVTCWKRF